MTKSIFKSRTALLAFITTVGGVVSLFVPSVEGIIEDNAGAILTTIGFIAVVLRGLTKDAVVLFPDDAEPTE